MRNKIEKLNLNKKILIETNRKHGTTNMHRHVKDDGSGITEWIAFELGESEVLKCHIGVNIGDVTILEDTECKIEEGGIFKGIVIDTTLSTPS